MSPEQRKKYAERELERFHFPSSIYYVHPRARLIYRIWRLVPLLSVLGGIFLVLTTLQVLEYFSIDYNDIEQLCKDYYIASYLALFLPFMYYLFSIYAINLMLSSVYFLGYYFGRISFDEALLLTKNPFALGSPSIASSLTLTYYVNTTLPQFSLEREDTIVQPPDLKPISEGKQTENSSTNQKGE